jgi:hypothetical protein
MATAIIDPATAKSLIQEYQSQNSAPGGSAIVTPNGQFLNGYFLDRGSIEDLLSNPNAVGISLLLAKDPNFVGAPTRQFTVLFTGATGSAAPYLASGNIYGPTPPCPPQCVTLS